MDIKLDTSWKQVLHDEFTKSYFTELVSFVRAEYANTTVFPPGPWIFRALDLCPFDKTEVVIIGQDPYHTPGAANGLSFSINSGRKLQPSLKNILKELETDLGVPQTEDGDLTRWAQQGVLMLNAILTVRAGEAGSHQGRGWEQFTDAIIRAVNEHKENVVFILWGKYAQEKGQFIDESKHLVIKSAHPSPYSASNGFFGSKPFSRANNYLVLHGKSPIKW